MTVRMKPLLWALALLALLFAPDLATAYYDPGVQRWINRDPRQEWSAINMYPCTANEPVASVDPSGLAVWKCTRTTDADVGRHAYLWDDRPGPREHSPKTNPWEIPIITGPILRHGLVW